MKPPHVSDLVHYVARGSADGKFPPICRAAIVAETVYPYDPEYPYVDVVVLNPKGIFFDNVAYDEAGAPGTWHWPEQEGNHVG